ncbi:MAG TPA: hypothetical protein VHL10_01740 [Nitrososphaera sp.]|nr:hypothetical protein [Nitrososphaera sp.]
MSKVKAKAKAAKRPKTVTLTQDALDALIAKASGIQQVPATAPVVEAPKPVVEAKPEATVNTVPTQVPYTDKGALAAHLAKARAAKATKDQQIKRYKELGIIPEDAVLSMQGLKILNEIMQLADRNGSPVLGVDQLKRLKGLVVTIGSLEQRLEVCEKALSLVLPLTVSRPRQIVKEIERPAKPQRAARVEEPEIETEPSDNASTSFWGSLFK